MDYVGQGQGQYAAPDDIQLSATQAYGVIPQAEYEARSGYRVVKISMHLDKRRRVEKDDFVISMRSFEGGLERAWASGAIRSSYVVLKPTAAVHAGYFRYFFKSVPYITALRATANFIRDGQDLNFGNFAAVPLPLVPLEEQAAIARFLDWANGRLERAIRAKRKVIALLNEQKQAIIHRAVTLGLDDSASLRHAGVDGAADVPQHWDVLALKRVLRRLIDCEHKTAPHVDRSEYRVIRTSAVRRGLLQLQGTYCTTESAFRAWTRRGLPEPGDVIFTREAPAGEACLVPNDLQLCLGQRTVLMKVRKQRLNPQFLIHMIYAGPPRSAISRASQGSTVGHFNVSDIGALTIFAPPIAEQEAIVLAVAQQTAGLDIAMRRLESEIDLLREYGTCLIADVVTGQLDVREAAARLPAEASDGDEVEPSDDAEALDEVATA